MRNRHNKSEHNERTSQEYQHVETLERKPAQISKIPPRTSAHPSALATVRPKYARNLDDQQRITPFDGVSFNPIELTRSTQRATDDIPTEHIFQHTEDIVSIDELDTFPQGPRERHQARSKKAPYDPVSQVDTLPTPVVQGQQGAVYAPVETHPLGELPHGLRRLAQSQGFSLGRWVDNVRWWLVFPGRIEFLLWLIGAIALVCLTSFFLLVVTIVWMR